MILEKFKFNGKNLEDGPSWGMTDISMGTMRFRWNETNENRNAFLKKLCGSDKFPAAVELIHSKTVYDIESADETIGLQGDGIITRNKNIVPVVTVADCMPIYVFDTKCGTFGTLHSGWKGTGIVGKAVGIIIEEYGSRPEDICVAIGPHIGDCCYNVTEERAHYFIDNFCHDCVSKISEDNYSLSLTKANLAVLIKCGIPEDNIKIMDECTCCHKENGEFKFGSFRRQTLNLPSDMPLEERLTKFTVQAAFVKW
ncbi:polyphenol oxidase family protein [Treponema sp.]|uniref:polyphenol oxidase family protein n=1 Tax=Treponema sp. TaxID=166 RepID=UPI00388EBC54